jgi:hypothetical protein
VLLIGADPFLLQSSDRLIALAAQHRIPAVYNTREFVAGGDLIITEPRLSDRVPAKLGLIILRRVYSGDLFLQLTL